MSPSPAGDEPLKLQLRTELAGRLRAAATAAGSASVEDFILDAAAFRADEILDARTIVAPDEFDRLVREADEPPSPDAALHDAVHRARDFREEP